MFHVADKNRRPCRRQRQPCRPRTRGGIRGSSRASGIRSAMDSATNAIVGTTAAEVSGHGLGDFIVGRIRVLGKKRCSGHDLTRLAIATLRNIFCDPSLLKWVRTILRETLNGGDRL